MATDIAQMTEAAPAGGGPTGGAGTTASAEHRRVLVILGALMLGMTLAALDQTIVSTALPTIAGDLHGLNHLAWVITSYLLASTISTPLWGKLGDLYGRKGFFQAAIVIFLVGSVFSGIAHNMTDLIASRAVQGIGAGGLIVGAQAVMGDIISPRQRGRYMGYFGAVFGVTSVLGPLLGGFFTEHLSWRWVFYINLPLGVIALFTVATVLHLPHTKTHHTIDYLGTVLLGAGVTGIVLLTTWGGSTYAWASPQIFGLGALSLVLIAAFVFVESRAKEPIIPLGLFRLRVFNVASGIGFIVGFIMFGSIIYIPLYLQTVHGASPTSSGLQLLPLVTGMLCTFIVSGRVVSKRGRYKIFPIIGTAVLTVGLLLLAQLTPSTGLDVSSLYMFVVGIGIGCVMQILVVAVQNAVPQSQLGVATSSATFFRQIGGSFGVALFGAIFNAQLFKDLPKYLPAAAVRSMHVLSGHNIASNPAQLAKLPPAIHHGFVLAFSHSLQVVFLFGVPFTVVAFGLTWLLQEVPLRDHAHMSVDGDGVATMGESTLAHL